MGLGIDKATQGYDKRNLKALKEEIKTSCIDPASDKLDTELDNLKAAIDEIWVGGSAEEFKKKMDGHVKSAKKQMTETKESLETYLDDIIKKLQDVDDDIILQ